MIAGIVLAGGLSQRMGQPKALLRAGDRTFLECALQTLSRGGCDDVVVVVNVEDRAIGDLITSAGAGSAFGGGPGTEQIESLRAGLRVLSAATEAAVVLPVDHPLVEPGTVRALIGAYRSRGRAVVRPVHQGRPGHPVLFAAAIFEDFISGQLSEGARSVVRDHADELEEVSVEDRGVVIDIDTPAEYEKQFGELP